MQMSKKRAQIAKHSVKSWHYLSPGDVVDVVAPGSACQPQDLVRALEYLKALGLQPRFEEFSLDAHHPFHSNSDPKRFEYLRKALSAKDSKAVWCLRGGYGAIRLMPFLLKMAKPKHIKLIVGYSDITSLHLFVNQQWKWPSLHGPLLENGKPGRLAKEDLEELKSVLFGEVHHVEEKLLPLNPSAFKLKPKKSVLAGGNLTTLASHSGTKVALKAKGKIVVLEDIGERGYRIDRFLEQLRQSQAFDGAVAIIFGDFTSGQEKDGRDFTQVAIDRFAEESKIPCFAGIKLGHGPRNRPWFFNTSAMIQGGSNPCLRVDIEGAHDSV